MSESSHEKSSCGEALIELFSEEIPARMQVRAAEDLQRHFATGLDAAGFAGTGYRLRSYATPRRLALVIEDLPLRQPDTREEKRGPREGAPPAAIDGFLKSVGLDSLDRCERRDTGKGIFYFAIIEKKGKATLALLEDLLVDAIGRFPWPKSMVWGYGTLPWVRPLHGVMLIFAGETSRRRLSFGGESQAPAVTFGNRTCGHRFLAPADFAIENFADYRRKLGAAKVEIDPATRRQRILEESLALAAGQGLTPKEDEGLLEEVVGLVEWPRVLIGRIDPSFMALPAEILTTAMRVHQKYFALLYKRGELAPFFLTIANNDRDEAAGAIIAGSERVLRARLADAQFFWEQDLKIPLADRLPALDGMTYHAKLGSMGDKARRLAALARRIGEALSLSAADQEALGLAAKLAKADLVSGTVGEFPELQGIVGGYCAARQGLAPAIAAAIGDHYKPAGLGSALPGEKLGLILALVDKIDSLVGFFAIEEKPTGSRDPFGLRRAALGAIAIIADGLKAPLDLKPIFAAAHALYQRQPGFAGLAAAAVDADLTLFFAERLKALFKAAKRRFDIVDAALAIVSELDLFTLHRRIDALEHFLAGEDGANLLIGLRRAANIVRIEEKKEKRVYEGAIDPALLIAAEEKALFDALRSAQAEAERDMAGGDFAAAMRAVALLRKPVDAFFAGVTVNDARPELRANRLLLLKRIEAVLAGIADFSRIEG